MLTIIITYFDDKKQTYTNVQDIVVYTNGDIHTNVYVSLKYGVNNYYNIYEKPKSISIM